MAARVEAVWNSERVLRVIATYWSKSLRREMDRSEAVRGCREQRAGSRVQRTECREQRAESREQSAENSDSHLLVQVLAKGDGPV